MFVFQNYYLLRYKTKTLANNILLETIFNYCHYFIFCDLGVIIKRRLRFLKLINNDIQAMMMLCFLF